LIVEFVVLAVVIALIRGGSIRRLEELRLNHLWLAFVPLGMVMLLGIAHSRGFASEVLKVSGILHVAGMVVWLVFFALNRQLAGSTLLVVGIFLNLLPIAVNQGKMPTSLQAVRIANVGPDFEKAVEKNRMQRHCLMSDETRLNFLADWIPFPKPPFIQPGVACPGDIINTVGMFFLVQTALGVSLRKQKDGKDA
jgi:hypothetical protein